MEIKDAVLKRIYNIATERNMMLNKVANKAGITPSTIYSMTSKSQRDVKITTISRICYAFDMTLSEFFDDELFKNLD